jgi:N6-adenosine-specific RNA methylase IME4
LRHGKLAFGTGYVLRCAGEPFLIGTRGKPKTTRAVRSIVEGPIREHSRKPDEAFAAAEKMMPDARRIELFSRQQRPGWTVWGNEIERFAPPASPEAPASAIP